MSSEPESFSRRPEVVSSRPLLTPASVMAATSELLIGAAYRRVLEDREPWSATQVRLFEDQYGIVAVCVFDTWEELREAWPLLQDDLVAVISEFMGASDIKAWEGYLVLLTPGAIPAGDAPEVEAIRYDMTRVRKLVAGGEDLTELSDVERILRPLLPIARVDDTTEVKSALDLLPQLLHARGIPKELTLSVVDAYRKQESLLERVHRFRTNR